MISTKKKLFLTISFIIALVFAIGNVPALADPPDFIPPGHQHGGGGDSEANAEINVGTGGLFNNSTNFSPSATATVEEGAVENFNTNILNYDPSLRNTNTNFNSDFNNVDVDTTDINKNVNINGQGQQQKQANKQTTILTFEDKRDHITGPGLMRADPKFAYSKSLSIKTLGWNILAKVEKLTWKQAKSLGKDASDFNVRKALIFEKSDTLEVTSLQPTAVPAGEFMGYLYLIPYGDKVNAAGGVGRIAIAAMKSGATHFRVLMVDTVEAVEGSAWNIGIGGGASIMADGGEKAIAPNGGTGYGKARAENDLRPAAIIELYYDESSVVLRWNDDK